jgi:hypothetical protein
MTIPMSTQVVIQAFSSRQKAYSWLDTYLKKSEQDVHYMKDDYNYEIQEIPFES